MAYHFTHLGLCKTLGWRLIASNHPRHLLLVHKNTQCTAPELLIAAQLRRNLHWKQRISLILMCVSIPEFKHLLLEPRIHFLRQPIHWHLAEVLRSGLYWVFDLNKAFPRPFLKQAGTWGAVTWIRIGFKYNRWCRHVACSLSWRVPACERRKPHDSPRGSMEAAKGNHKKKERKKGKKAVITMDPRGWIIPTFRPCVPSPKGWHSASKGRLKLTLTERCRTLIPNSPQA